MSCPASSLTLSGRASLPSRSQANASRRIHSWGYELFADLDNDPFADGDHHRARSVKRPKVSQAFPEVGSKMLFLFDYGAQWRFRVEVIGFGKKVPRTRYPRVLAIMGKAPPQYPDIGEADG